jgi:hypothetical protein
MEMLIGRSALKSLGIRGFENDDGSVEICRSGRFLIAHRLRKTRTL